MKDEDWASFLSILKYMCRWSRIVLIPATTIQGRVNKVKLEPDQSRTKAIIHEID